MRRILVTGGTGVVGKNLIKGLLTDGHEVAFTTRSKSKGERFAEEENFDLNKITVVEAEFEEDGDLDEILSQLSGPINGVIFNARTVDNIVVNQSGFISSKQFQDELFMAVTFPYLLTNAILARDNILRDIVFISSMYGVVAPTPSLYDDFKRSSAINYGVAKAAQIHLAKELAVRLAEKKVKCNCVSYGGIEGRMNKDFMARYKDLNPMGRMLGADDIYPPVKFILDNPDLAITGQNIKVDGGWTIW